MHYSEARMDDRALVAAAREAAELAYAPYSGFRVGAVVVAGGETYRGANVENSAYPSTVCAEAAAIAHAASCGVRKIDTVAVACIDAADEPGYPCGNCRQMMVEFGVERVLVDGPGGPREHTLDELIPYGFKFSD